MTTLAEGIKQGALAPVTALNSGFAKMRQLLPFSDAKEGPLSSLTLSGSKIFSTIGEGMRLTQNIPAQLANQAFSNINVKELNEKTKSELVTNNSDKKVSLKETFTSFKEQDVVESSKGGTSITIGNMTLNFDIKDLEDIKLIKKLMDELKDLQNQEDDDMEVVPVWL